MDFLTFKQDRVTLAIPKLEVKNKIVSIDLV